MPKYVFINGAPRSGKDTIARHLFDNFLVNFERFSMPHKRAFAQLIGADCDRFGYVFGYEERKDDPLAILNGKSFRQWQIDFSESFMKPLYGQEVFARLLRARCAAEGEHTIYVVPDCGSQVEVDCFASDAVLLITVKRDGYDFSSDSRQYVNPAKGWTHVTLYNNGTIDDLCTHADKVFTSWRDALK